MKAAKSGKNVDKENAENGTIESSQKGSEANLGSMVNLNA